MRSHFYSHSSYYPAAGVDVEGQQEAFERVNEIEALMETADHAQIVEALGFDPDGDVYEERPG